MMKQDAGDRLYKLSTKSLDRRFLSKVKSLQNLETRTRKNLRKELQQQLNLLTGYEFDPNKVIQVYTEVVDTVDEKSNVFKALNQQLSIRKLEYVQLEKEKERLMENIPKSMIIEEEHNKFTDSDKDMLYTQSLLDGQSMQSITSDFTEYTRKFAMKIDGYLSDLLQQIIFKLSKICFLAKVNLGEDVKLLIETFSTDQRKSLFNKIIINSAQQERSFKSLRNIFDAIENQANQDQSNQPK